MTVAEYVRLVMLSPVIDNKAFDEQIDDARALIVSDKMRKRVAEERAKLVRTGIDAPPAPHYDDSWKERMRKKGMGNILKW